MINFCTLFDSNYMSRGLAMYHSLLRNCENVQLYIVCLDQKLYNSLQQLHLEKVVLIQLQTVEEKYPELSIAKNNRTYVEYIFTLSPLMALYVFQVYEEVNLLTTLDADIYFFSDPSVLIDESYSISITSHNFKKNFHKYIVYGKYNVSFQTFKRDAVGLYCLKKWKIECIDLCYDIFQDDKFADQKYLDIWIAEHANLHEYDARSGVAPWNIIDSHVRVEGDNIYVNRQKLIYYHFHGMRNITESVYSIGLTDYRVGHRKNIVKYIYLPYIQELSKNIFIPNNNIVRRMQLRFGKFIYLIFLADLYYFRNDKLCRIYNLNIFRRIYSYLKSI